MRVWVTSMKSHNHGPYFWRRVVNVVLCVVLLGANMMAVSAAAESMRDEPLVEEERQSTESVSPGADATEELLESSTVKERIDAVLALLERTDELDEEGMLSLSEKAIAAKRAYERMTREEQSQIDADKIDKLLAFVETLNVQPLEDGNSTVNGMKIATAEIWAEGMDNQTLSDGSSFTIDFSKQFTLHIAVNSELNLANKMVEITVPDGLTVVEYPIPVRGDMAESVTPDSIDELHSANNYGGYHPTNGTITYSLKNTAEKNSFNIVLAPDTVLWNRSSAQVLKDPLKIRVYTDVQTYQTISATPKITGKYTPPPPSRPDQKPEEAGSRAIQTGPRLSRIGVKTGVPTAANQPFALRQIWINPDKDYIDMPQFFKKLEITIALPYYEKNGSNIYAELDHITFDPAGQSTRPNLLDPENHDGANDNYTYTETPNNTDHTVTLTWENLYLEYGQEYFTPYFKWTTDCDVTATNAVKWGSDSILNTGKSVPGCYEGKTPTTGDASAVGGTITWQGDSTWYLYNGDCTTFSFTAQAGENMSVTGKANNQPIYNNFASDSGITYYLGQFHVVNQGGAASADKTVEFTYGSNNKIGVTAQKIPATTGNEVTVCYQTTNTTGDTWTQYSGGTLTSSGGFVTFTAQMAGLSEGEYFTKIKANVGSYEKDYVGYVASRDQDPTSGYATTFGKLLTAEAGTYSNFASMKMYDTASGDSTAKSGKYTVKVTNTRGEIPLAMEQAYKEGTLERVPILSKTSATAGDTIAFNGLLSSSAYPYSSNNVTTDQEIYIRLPEKITVENLKLYQEEGRTADKVFLLDAVMETVMKPKRTEIPKNAYKFEAVTSAEEGYKLYKITFTNQDNPAKVGWFTDGLGQYQIGISFDMNIAKNADAMTLDMRDCVRFKSASLKSTSNNGTLAQYQVMDNGARYSTFNVNAKGTKLSVVAARLGLTFTFGARVAGEKDEVSHDPKDYSNFEEKGDKVYLKDSDHVVDMLFTLKNDTGREFGKEDAQAFYYFIPVPKAGDLWDSHMQDHAFEFDMALTGEAELNGASVERGHIQVTYSTTVASNASAGDPRHYSTVTGNYVTADKINDWGAVKMIRVAATKDTDQIPKDADLKVNLRLKPAFNENADLVGSEINFGPCGVSPYSVGSTLNQGHNPLPRIQVEFQTGVIGGKIFIDKNFNGAYDEGTDQLYTGDVAVEANHSNGNENCTEGDAAHKATATGGTFSFNGRRADTYHVVVTNPGSTDANGNNPLKFSLPESGGKFSLDAGKNTATASVVLDMNKTPNDIKDAGSLLIGFQQPHTVTFSVPNGKDGTTTKVWHGDKLGDVIPTVTADKGYRFTGNWTVGAKTYTADQLKKEAISSDVTFTAEVKKLYSLTYDLNGGSGATAPATSTHIEGEKVSPDYTGTGNLKKGEKTIFAGWSKTQIEDPLPEDAAQADIDKIISHDEHIMPAQNVTLYAVYAVDANGNGKPDYNDDAVHVRYHGNNNVREDILCPHHHVAGATAKLSTSGMVSGKSLGHDKPASDASGEVASHTFTYGTNIFIGWSTKPILDKVIETKAEYNNLKSSIKNEVTMLEKPGNDVSDEDAKDTSKYADKDGNTNVYAVWAADRNGNNTADYLEEYTLTYDGNAQQGGTVTSLPTDTDIHIPNDKVTLNTTKPTHNDVDSKKVVFIGWTEAQTNAIFSRADTAPATVTEVTFGNANKTVYAAWGYDENNDGTADVLETYTLTYDLNGGNETAPAKVSGIAKNTEITLTADKNFIRNTNEVFVGWSVTKHNAALTAETKQEDLEKFLIAPGAKYRIQTEDVTLYAVWAADSNKNGMADYLEAYATINAVKILEGRDWLESNSFEFKLTALDGAPMPKDDDGETLDTVTVSGKGAGVGKKAGEKVTFDFGEITYDKAGAYTYEVSEVAGENKGMVYDPNKAIVTIEVENNNGFNKLKSINYDNGFKAPADAAMFANHYKANMTYGDADRVDVAMTLNGRAMHKDEFAFKIDGNDDESRSKLSSLDAEFSVTEDTAAGAKHVMQNKFQGLEFTQDDVGKTYTYTVKEDIPADKIPGVTYDSAVYTVKITPKDNGDGTMHAETVVIDSSGKTINPSAPDGKSVYEVSFVNTYKADSFIFDTAAGFNLSKKLEGRDWLNGDSFEFTLAARDSAPMPATDKVTVNNTNLDEAGEKAAFGFGEITYTEPGVYTYEVCENDKENTIDGVEYDDQVAVITVTVTDKLNGTMEAKAEVTRGKAIFTNKYATGGIEVNTDPADTAALFDKVLTGRDWTADDSFEFELTAVDGAPMPEGTEEGATSKTVTLGRANAKAGDHVAFGFGKIKVTDDNMAGARLNGDGKPAKTFEYKVTEAKGSIAGVKYDEHAATLKVTVVDNLNGTMTATPAVTEGTFTNSYEARGTTFNTASVNLNKVLKGRDWLESDSFEFKLEAVTDGAPMPANDKKTVTKAALKDGKAAFGFGEIKFDEAGDYTYRVTETNAGKTINGITYTPHPATFTVHVTDLGNNGSSTGRLAASVTQVLNQEFENIYVSKLDYGAKGGLSIFKTLNGRDMAANQFGFTVKPVDQASADKFGIDLAGEEFKNPDAATAGKKSLVKSFGEDVEFSQDDAGKTYSYVVSETTGGNADEGYTNDTAEYTVTIATEHDPATAALTVTTTVSDGTNDKEYVYTTDTNPDEADAAEVSFVNRYGSSGTLGGDGNVKIHAVKQLTGRDQNAGEFSFVVEDKDGNEVSSGENAADGTVEFDPIHYTSDSLEQAVANGLAVKTADAGGKITYELPYKVSEVTSNLPGVVSGNVTSFNVVVKLVDDGDGVFDITVEYPAGMNELSFENTYTSTAPFTPSGSKWLDGGAPVSIIDGKFTFTISGEEKAPLPDVTSVKNDAVGDVRFGEITFTQDHLDGVTPDENGARTKTFTYHVTEIGTASGITNDAQVTKTFKLTVTDDGQGHMRVESDHQGAQFEFTNTYSTTPKESSLTGEGGFTLTKTLDGRDLVDGEFEFDLVDVASGKVVAKGENDESGNVKMGAVTFEEPGTHQYRLVEVNPNESDGITYDASSYDVSAVATDVDFDGVLEIVWSVAETEGTDLKFVNSYKAAPSSITFNAIKQLDGRDIKAGEFEFELVQDDKVIQTAKNVAPDKSGVARISFEPIEYAETGEFDYEIREVKGDAEGVTYDDQVFTYHVTVTDPGTGKLKVEWAQGDNGAPVFKNVYEKQASPLDPVLPPDDGDDDDNGGNNGNGGGDNVNDGSGDAGIDAGNGNGDGGSGDTGDGDKLPKTGDTSPIVPLTVVVVLAACVAAVAALRMRRN